MEALVGIHPHGVGRSDEGHQAGAFYEVIQAVVVFPDSADADLTVGVATVELSAYDVDVLFHCEDVMVDLELAGINPKVYLDDDVAAEADASCAFGFADLQSRKPVSSARLSVEALEPMNSSVPEFELKVPALFAAKLHPSLMVPPLKVKAVVPICMPLLDICRMPALMFEVPPNEYRLPL